MRPFQEDPVRAYRLAKLEADARALGFNLQPKRRCVDCGMCCCCCSCADVDNDVVRALQRGEGEPEPQWISPMAQTAARLEREEQQPPGAPKAAPHSRAQPGNREASGAWQRLVATARSALAKLRRTVRVRGGSR